MEGSKSIKTILLIITCIGMLALVFCNRDMYIYFLCGIKGELLPATEYGRTTSRSLLAEIIPTVGMAEDASEYYVSSTHINEGEIIPADAETTMEATYVSSTGETQTEATETSTASTIITTQEKTVIEAANLDGIVSGPTPIHYSMSQLEDFDSLISNCYVVDSSTYVTSKEMDADKLLSMDMGIDLSTDEPKVLIYHTHGSEAFADSREGAVEDTVIGVGDELARILEEDYGIGVYHDRNVYDYVNGILDRSNAYNLAGAAVDEILAQNPSIEVVIDLHRDGVREDLRLVRTVDGKDTACIMFLNGVSRLKSSGDIEYLQNPHKEENLSFSLKLFLNGRSLYGDLIRKIYIRGYCFNLDRAARASLVEVGAQTNTVEEAKNAMGPLARVLYQVLSE